MTGRAGRPRTPGALRTKTGRKSRSRASMLSSGELVHKDYAVYFAVCDGKTKIGFSGQLQARMSTLSWENGAPVNIIALAYAPSEVIARALERQLHQRFEGYRIEGEWFDLGRDDILDTLARCRKIGIRVAGGVDASDDLPVLSGMAYASQREGLPISR